jgi:hypothetical protein
MTTEAWIARSAAALCRGARWPIALSLALAVLGAARLLFEPRQAPVEMTLVLVAGLAQGYLALRIELDRRIFERFAEEPASAPGFDAALAQAGWAAPRAAPRAMADRGRGVRRLVAISFALLVAQGAAVATAAWAGR